VSFVPLEQTSDFISPFRVLIEEYSRPSEES
jgi:hypothetical protein